MIVNPPYTIGQHTYREIYAQPQSWSAGLQVLQEQQSTIQAAFSAERFDQILFTGCGSTYYLALAAAAATLALTRIPTRGLPASELWLNPETAYPKKPNTMLIAVSRSGETTETLRACDAFLASKAGTLLTLSCYPERDLARMGSLNLVFPAAQELSVAQTQAFSTLYLACLAIAAIWSGNQALSEELKRLPQAGTRLLNEYAFQGETTGNAPQLQRFYFLGSGGYYGLACELSLKMKEMSLSHSEPFHFLEFRHGPKSMVNDQALVIGLLSKQNIGHERAVLREMRQLGGRVLAMTPDPLPSDDADDQVILPAEISDLGRAPLYLPIGQLIAYHRALLNRQNPDQPTNLTDVVRLS
jgi:glucosamine--fructose-6-phosphate aminotransferase (isomerizing)